MSAAPPPGYGYPHPYGMQPPRPSGGGGGAIITILLLFVVGIPLLGTLAALAIYGVRKYVVNAKTMEARSSLAQIGKAAATSYQAPNLDGSSKHVVCPSASRPVPRNRSDVSGRKYQSSRVDWEVDRDANAGFSCLHYEMSVPQYFQYVYSATSVSMNAEAHGDLNGDGMFSDFVLEGRVEGAYLVLAPTIRETNPEQ